MKVCSRCFAKKPLDAFENDVRYRLGVTGWCKACRAECRDKRRKERRERYQPLIGLKMCRDCGVTKERSDFPRSNDTKDGVLGFCKKCKNAREQTPRMSSDSGKRNHLWSHYRMKPEDYVSMVDAQSGRCAICAATDKRLIIDHCHATSEVRGLLCDRCNTHLRAIEDEAFVVAAREYLNGHTQWQFASTPYNASARESRERFKRRVKTAA